MTDRPQWESAPALGLILAKMAELYTRAVRVELERRRRASERVVVMLAKDTSK